MDWNIMWLITGGAAFLLVVVNLIRSLLSKKEGWQIMMFASLSCGAVTVLEEYRMVNIWLQHGEMAVLEDAVPALTQTLTAALYIGIALNLIVLLMNTRNTDRQK